MKRVIGFLSVIVLLTFIGCSNESSLTSHNVQNPLESKAEIQSTRFISDTYQADLTGDASAVGRAVFNLIDNNTKLHYRLHVFNMSGVTVAHIHHAHGGAPTGHAILTLFNGQTGDFSGKLVQGVLTADDITCSCSHQDQHTLTHLKKHFDDGETYVNVHTLENPSGEIRGWIAEK